jgi:hypothetical protein
MKVLSVIARFLMSRTLIFYRIKFQVVHVTACKSVASTLEVQNVKRITHVAQRISKFD